MKISLKQALDLGLQRNLELKAEAYKSDQAAADMDRVYGEFGPKLESIAGVGPITKTTGNALNSDEDKSKLGVIFIGKLELTQPIFTWGRKNDYLHAAKHGKIVKGEELRQKRIDLRFQIKESYYGTLYALSLYDFIQSGKEDLDRVEKELGKKISKEDKFRLEIFRSQVEAKEAEVKKTLELAKASLSLRVGAPHGEAVLPSEEWIESADRALRPLEFYQQIARQQRPEYRELEAGISAKKSLAIAEKKGDYPVLAIMARYDFAYSNVRQDQQSVFAYDPYNQDNVVFGLGIKWDFQWGLQDAKAAKYRAEAMELEAKQSFAEEGLAVLVQKAWLELEEADTKLQAANKAAKAAKKWLNQHMMGVSTGLGDVKKIVEAYHARALTLKDYYEAIYNHHMAWAQLTQAVGDEVDPTLK